MPILQKIKRKAKQAYLEGLSLNDLTKRLRARRGVVGLCYHTLSDELDDYPYRTRPDAFDRHLGMLGDIFEILPADTAVQELGKGTLAERERPVAVLCFDDGYRDNWTIATTILEKYDVPATLFAPRDLIQREGQSHMNETELAELSRHPLWRVGAHGVTHNVLTGFNAQDQIREMVECRDWLSGILATTPTGFAYPQGQISPQIVEIARQHFDHAFTTDTRLSTGFDRHQIRRYCPMQTDDDLTSFARSIVSMPFEDGTG